MQIIAETGQWRAIASYAEKDALKAAGFRWNPDRKYWYTRDADTAAKLMSPDGAAKVLAAAEERKIERAAAVEASRAADADINLPCPDGLAYLPFQRAGIAAGLKRQSVLYGDEMGLGKTIQAIGIINADPTLKRILVICPASLKLNWRNELRRWLCRDMSIAIASAQSCEPGMADITIINYDIVAKLAERLRSVTWDAIVLDEAHYLKNPDAKRTQAIVGREKKGVVEQAGLTARRRIALTGTPIPNRPIEGWSIFHFLAPDEFRSFFGYAKRYAAAHENGYGWDFSGASNLPELQEKLRASIMIRRLKADVLTELPAKRRAIIEIAANGATGIVAAERAAWEASEDRLADLRAAVELAKASADPQDYADAVANLKTAASAAFNEMSALRHATAVAKIPYVIEHVRDNMDAGKIILFAHHHDVIETVAAELGSAAVTVYGSTPIADRQAAVERFQTDPTCRVFIGGILAAGVGLTLTASSHVIFAELDWVPGNMTQAEDRAHRIGQTQMVLVQHLVLEGSLDARMAQILVAKQEVLAAALDDVAAAEPVLPVAERERAATESVRRAQIDAAAEAMTPERIAAIHRGLTILCAYDGDHAQKLNGMGYSKVDTYIGHKLAECGQLTPRQAVLGAKLVNKYRRQLPAEIIACAAGKTVVE